MRFVKEHRHNYSGAVVTPQFKLFRRPVSPIKGYANSVTKMETLQQLASFSRKSSRTHSAFAARAFYERFLELNHSTIVKKWYSALEGRLRPSRVRSYVLWRSASHSSFVLDLGVLFYRPRMGLRNSAMGVLRLHSPYRDNLPLLLSPGPILVCTYTILLQATGLHPPASRRFLRSRLLRFGFGM